MSSTDISEIDVSFKLHLSTFSAKSVSMAKAEKIIKKYGSIVPDIPENIEHIIQKAKEHFSSNNEEKLTEKELRIVAFESLSRDEGDRFFSNLLKVVDAAKSRRVFSALFSSYIMNFDKHDERIIQAAKLLKKHQKTLSKSWVRRLESFDLLAFKTIETSLAKKIMEEGDDHSVLDRAGLTGAFSASRLVQSSLIELANQVSKRIEGGNTDALYDFLKIVCVGDKIKQHAGAAAMIASLKPFIDSSPPAHLKGLLQKVFIGSFSDPRITLNQWPEIPAHLGGTNLRTSCIGLIKKWLNFEAIELFFKVIAAHAPDEQFEPRKNLWKSYFDQEFVVDAHIILGQSADLTAKHLRNTDEAAQGLIWGNLSGANPDQSVLLMQIGDLTVAEWSHNGKFRAWDSDSPKKPRFYRSAYSASELRLGSNKIRNKNGSFGDGIVHLGDWVPRAKTYVNQATGIRLSRKIRS